MNYRLKAGMEFWKAIQWFQNGDHPNDNSTWIESDDERFLSEGEVVRRFRRPDYPGEEKCPVCGHIYHDHGWIEPYNVSRLFGDIPEDGVTVHPGDYILTDKNNKYYPVDPDLFESLYEERPEEEPEGFMEM